MAPVLCSAYLPPISFFRVMKNSDRVLIEQHDNYVKQTYRNRCRIATESGVLTLSIPVVKSSEPKQPMHSVRISSHGNWKRQHWNALASAYMGTPFFIYYQDEFKAIYERDYTFLTDFNADLTRLMLRLSGIETEIVFTDHYCEYGECDLRNLVEPAASPQMVTEPYFQVFRQKNGFIPDLSMADLLFNMGPESILYL